MYKSSSRNYSRYTNDESMSFGFVNISNHYQV